MTKVTKHELIGLAYGLVGFLLFVIGALVSAIFGHAFGLPMLIVGFLVGVYGFIRHVPIVLQRLAKWFD